MRYFYDAGIDIGQYFVAMQIISETKGDVDPKTGNLQPIRSC